MKKEKKEEWEGGRKNGREDEGKRCEVRKEKEGGEPGKAVSWPVRNLAHSQSQVPNS